MVVRKITMSASPPWLESIVASLRVPFRRCWWAMRRIPGKFRLILVRSQSCCSKTCCWPKVSTCRSSSSLDPALGAGERL
eukprot:6397128-Pyramimonas_sp.AAC.1